MRRSVRIPLVAVVCLAALGAGRVKRRPWTLGSGDVVRMQIWNHEIDVVVTVTPQGSVVFPLVGKVVVDGLTEKEAETLIGSRYRKGFLKDPQVVLTIEKYLSHKVSVFGEAKAPGDYPLIGRMTLADLYNKVGGHTMLSNGRIVVRRPVASESVRPRRLWRVSVAALLSGDPKADIVLADGDRVFFPSRTAAQHIDVRGAVKKPGRYPLYPGMNIVNAISAAGGLAANASNRVRLFRRSEVLGDRRPGPGEKEGGAGQERKTARIFYLDRIAKGKQKDIAPADGDYIIVESSETVRPGIWILGAVAKEGWYPWPENKELTVRKALTLAGGASAIASFWRLKIDREIKGQVHRMRAKLDTMVKPGDTILVPESWI